MRTTLNLSDTLIAQLMKVSGARTKTEAIHLAISEFIRQKKLAKLRSLSGKLRIDLDWREMEEAEMKSQESRERAWHDRG
jgi:hypothetical protein